MNTREIAGEYRLSHWAQIMRERKESGLSIKAYCEKSGFHENVYFYWQRKLREEACRHMGTMQPEKSEGGLAPAGFTEVKLMSSQIGMLHQERTSPGSFNIEVSGMRISADSNYPVEKLVCLLRELVRPC